MMKPAFKPNPPAKTTRKAALCREAFDWLFNHIDHHLLLGNSKYASPFITKTLTSGGYRLTEQGLKLRQVRLYQALAGAPVETERFVSFLRRSKGEARTLFTLLPFLSEKILPLAWRDAIRTAQNPGVITAAMLHCPQDSRLFRTAFRLLKCPAAWKPRETAEPPRETAEFIGKIREAHTCLHTLFNLEQAPGNEKTDTAANTDHDDIQKQLRAEYTRGKQEQETRNAEERKQLKADVRDLRQQLENAQKTIRELEQNAEQTHRKHREDLRQAAQNAETHYIRTLEDFKKQYFLDDPGLAHDTAQSQITTENLLEQLRKTTEEQHTLNRRAGVKSALRNQHAQITEALNRLRTALDDAVIPAPNAAALIRNAEAHLAAITRKLIDAGDDTLSETLAAPHVFSQLECCIQAVKLDPQASRTLQNLETFIGQTYEHDILSLRETQTLKKFIRKRQSVLQAAQTLELAPKQPPRPEPEPRKAETIFILPRFKNQFAQATLIFDGYNTMKRNDPWMTLEQTRTFEIARYQFIQTITAKAHLFQNIDLVFDGSGTTKTAEYAAPNVRVIFSAHINDKHNADDCIIEQARTLRTANPHALIWAVTDDYDLRTQLEQTCDALVDTTAIPAFFLATP